MSVDSSAMLRIGIVGAGWAGLAAAVECAAAGAHVAVFEMAPLPGGRARDIGDPGGGLDNGQHIAIGAYRSTLGLLARIGVTEGDAFLRRPLVLVDPTGLGLRLPSGNATLAFAAGVLRRRGWSWRDRFALLAAAARWRRDGFACAPTATVADLTRALPAAIRADLVEPLCVAALNTPASHASASVFLRILRDALAGGRGGSDLLLPKVGLSAVLPGPATAWLTKSSCDLRFATRVGALGRDADRWSIDGEPFDRIVVAASPVEAARLVEPHDARWSGRARRLAFEPIATVYATSDGVRLPEPMLMLAAGPQAPAQFVFDRGALGGPQGLLAFVVSGAAAWVERGLDATETAAIAQGRAALARHLRAPLVPLRTVVEKRATFRCVPGLDRPPMRVDAPSLFVAGDYVEGPYPATLEGAVRSGIAAAHAALGVGAPR